MSNFKVEIKEILSKVLDIQADSAEEALLIVKTMYADGDVALDGSDGDDGCELCILED